MERLLPDVIGVLVVTESCLDSGGELSASKRIVTIHVYGRIPAENSSYTRVENMFNAERISLKSNRYSGINTTWF